jgi:hypothetical protein
MGPNVFFHRRAETESRAGDRNGNGAAGGGAGDGRARERDWLWLVAMAVGFLRDGPDPDLPIPVPLILKIPILTFYQKYQKKSSQILTLLPCSLCLAGGPFDNILKFLS